MHDAIVEAEEALEMSWPATALETLDDVLLESLSGADTVHVLNYRTDALMAKGRYAEARITRDSQEKRLNLLKDDSRESTVAHVMESGRLVRYAMLQGIMYDNDVERMNSLVGQAIIELKGQLTTPQLRQLAATFVYRHAFVGSSTIDAIMHISPSIPERMGDAIALETRFLMAAKAQNTPDAMRLWEDVYNVFEPSQTARMGLMAHHLVQEPILGAALMHDIALMYDNAAEQCVTEEDALTNRMQAMSDMLNAALTEVETQQLRVNIVIQCFARAYDVVQSSVWNEADERYREYHMAALRALATLVLTSNLKDPFVKRHVADFAKMVAETADDAELYEISQTT